MGATLRWRCRCSNNRCAVSRPTTSTSGRFTGPSFRMTRNSSSVPAARQRHWKKRKNKARYASSGSLAIRTLMCIAMLNTGFPFDAVQMPLNAFDATYFMSFEQKVLPVLNQRGIAPLGMKPISGHGDPVQMGVLTASEALRYAMSLPVACTISGAEELHIIEQNLEIAQNFVPMTPAEMQALRDRCRKYAADWRFELYKASLKFDNPEARLAHDYPLDPANVEVKDMMREADNTGHAWPVV